MSTLPMYAPGRRTLPVSQEWGLEGIEAYAERVHFFWDVASYYAMLTEVLLQAKRSIVIAGWEVHFGVALKRPAAPISLEEVLKQALRDNPELQVRIVVWEGSVFHGQLHKWRQWAIAEEEFDEERLAFVLYETPSLFTLHDKIVVVDESLAFMGSTDLTQMRWDEAPHRVMHERRIDPEGDPYGPVHDLQVMVTGEIVDHLSALLHKRWVQGGGAPPRHVPDGMTWPEGVEAHEEELGVVIARSTPDWLDQTRLHIEHNLAAVIAGAQEYIFLESQYYSVRKLHTLLMERLQEPDGPVVILVVPQQIGFGVGERWTIGKLTHEAIRELRRVAPPGRLAVVTPRDLRGEDGDGDVYVHAKVCVVDGEVAKIGSSNLAERSMNGDSETDLFFGGPAAARLLETLFALHFHTQVEVVRAARSESETWVEAVRRLQREAMTHALVPFRAHRRTQIPGVIHTLWDPRWSGEALEERWPSSVAQRQRVLRGILIGAAAVTTTVGAVAAWRWLKKR